MQAWDHIVHTALLGTDKRQPDAKQFPAALAEAAELISIADKEEQFLQTAALAFNFRQCGVTPLHKEGIDFPVAAPEEKQYCSGFAMQVLKDILDIQSTSLLKLWLKECDGKQMIVTPELVPNLLDKGVYIKNLQSLIANCCGKRGEWLSRFNNEWNFSSTSSDEQVWETGTTDQRTAVLTHLHQQNPALAREWLQKTWDQEDANTRAKLLDAFDKNVTDEDVPFLESLLNDKSKKVKDAATELLKQNASSSIVKQYWQILQRAVYIKKERSFLGIGKSTGLKIELPDDIDKNIFKTTGIEQLSPKKEISDQEFILMQLASHIPMRFWEDHLQLTPEAIIDLFQKHASGKHFMISFVKANSTYKDERWAIAFMQHSDIFYVDIIPFLPIRQQEHYSIKFMQQQGDNLISYATRRHDEWGLELTEAILKYAARNMYRYDRGFFSDHINNFPAAAAQRLEKATPSEEHLRGAWSNISDHIIKLLTLKLQTLKAFNE